MFKNFWKRELPSLLSSVDKEEKSVHLKILFHHTIITPSTQNNEGRFVLTYVLSSIKFNDEGKQKKAACLAINVECIVSIIEYHITFS